MTGEVDVLLEEKDEILLKEEEIYNKRIYGESSNRNNILCTRGNVLEAHGI